MKGLKRDKIAFMVANTPGLCTRYTHEQIDQMFINGVGLDGITNYKLVLIRPIPNIEKCWMAVSPEMMEDNKLAYIYMWLWNNIMKSILNKYSQDTTPQQMIDISKSYLNNEISINNYLTIYSKYNSDYIEPLITNTEINNVQKIAVKFTGINCFNKGYAYQAILHAVHCVVADGPILPENEIKSAEDAVFQRIIDQCILTME